LDRSSIQSAETPAQAPRSFGCVHSRGQGLVVNADDWGLNSETTDRTLDCILRGSVSAVSAMVLMEDSERAADIACQNGIDAGLHLNLTAPSSAQGVSSKLIEHQRRVREYLRRSRFAQAVFNPLLSSSFDYLVKAQIAEFARLYGREPERFDGHHHMHLCANVLLGGLIPPRTLVRRSFSFRSGEKGFANLWYRRGVDSLLRRNHQVTDFFFSIQPLAPLSRLKQILALACSYKVEMETHPQVLEEHIFLTGNEFQELFTAPQSMTETNPSSLRAMWS
jgi:hypothetical protein